MLKVSVIGSGNVAHHLVKVFLSNSKVDLIQVFARNKSAFSGLVPDEMLISDYADLKDADLYLVSVSDAAIADVTSMLPFKSRLVAHTSGATDLSSIDSQNRAASFYPLQTFSKSKAVDMNAVPICIEATSEDDLKVLRHVAKSISDQVYEMNSEQRRALHLSAVFACNFTNHMYAIADEICRVHNINFDILKPLIAETAEKVMHLPPLQAQTGPALRQDQESMNNHLNLLTDQNLKSIYSILSKSIHAKKL